MSSVSKVVFGNTTVMDITDSTVDSDTLLTGTKAYRADGEPVIGGVVKSWTGTMAQYLEEASQIADGTQVNILDDFTPVGDPIGIADIYSTAEREIGVWTDGKPLYEKTYEITTPSVAATPTAVIEYPSTFAIKVIDGLYNNANPINVYRGSNYYTATFNNKTNHTIDVETKGISVGVSGVIILKYTKTTDTPGSGKYVPSGAPAVHYSTDEEIIGTWIDGKPIYEITATGTTPNTYDSWVELINLNCTVENVIYHYGTIKRGDNESYPGTYLGDYASLFKVFSNGSVQIRIKDNYLPNHPYTFTIQYTKATD